MNSRESGGPSPEDMNFKSPDNQQENPGEAKAEEEPLVELQSRDASKYTSGELFDNGQIKGVIERIDFMHNTIFVRPEKQEQPKETRESEGELIELGSRDVTKYKAGEMFDNGEVRGIIRRIDYMNSTIAIEKEKESGEGKR